LTDAAVEASEVAVTPRKIGCLQLVSNESVNDAAAAEIIGRALVAALADRVDHSFFSATLRRVRLDWPVPVPRLPE
jgi:hypothetical protein